MIVRLKGICVWRVVGVFAASLAATSTVACARSVATVPPMSTVVLTVDTSQPGGEFAPGSVGLSLGAQELSSGYLNARHHRLVRLMRLLGPSILRVGANSVDLSWWTSNHEPPPRWATNTVTPTDLMALRRLLTATGWRLLLGVNFGHFEPTRAVDETRYAQKILGPELLGIEIGNEPDEFSNPRNGLRPPTYDVSEYLSEAEDYRQALGTTTPRVAIYGPATGGTRWLTAMGAAAGVFTELTQHYYATSTCPNVSPSAAIPPATAAGLLSPEVRQQENDVLDALSKAGDVTGRPTRIGETNDVSCDGSVSTSSVFASALWSLDWVLRAASSGVTGLSFHGWLGGCGVGSYSPICVSGDAAQASAGDVTAQPEYYGLLAASQLEGGRFVPIRMAASAQLPNITTWATLAPGGTVRIVIDDLAISGATQTISVPTAGYTATEEPLVAPSVEARGGITLGAASVTTQGRWIRKAQSAPAVRDSIRVVIRPASAIIVNLVPKRSR
jgi:hypothetical protein